VIALDTNLLIYSFLPGVPEHRPARRAIEDALNSADGCGICWPSIAEFWCVVSHPTGPGRGNSPIDAQHYIHQLVDTARISLWLPSGELPRRALRTAVQMDVRGPRIFDLHIALIAMENGADQIWTHDQRFVRIKGLRVYDPLV
jgi:predicted nucleic acid-binding protein